MVSGSEKGWNNIQSYLKGPGHGGEVEERGEEREEEVGGGEEKAGYDQERQGEEEGEEEKEEGEDLTRKDISDLLGHQPPGEGGEGEGEGREHARGKRKKKSKKTHAQKERDEEPPLISFNDEVTTTQLTPSVQPAAMEGSPRARNKAKSGGGAGGGGYGSVGGGGGGKYGGYGSTTTKPTSTVESAAQVDDWSGDWMEEWLGGGNGDTADSSPSKSSGWDDWKVEDGWSNVDLKHN